MWWVKWVGMMQSPGPYKREAEVSEAEQRDALKELETGVIYFEGWGRGHNPSNAGSLWKLQKVRKWILFWSLRK